MTRAVRASGGAIRQRPSAAAIHALKNANESRVARFRFSNEIGINALRVCRGYGQSSAKVRPVGMIGLVPSIPHRLKTQTVVGRTQKLGILARTGSSNRIHGAALATRLDCQIIGAKGVHSGPTASSV